MITRFAQNGRRVAKGGHYAELYTTYYCHQSLAYVEQAREMVKQAYL
ncbi:MAG: hypothetical protein ACOYZ8_05640 [Chloroflexota bacterium]